MTNKQSEQSKDNTDAEDDIKQKGLSKEAWAAVSAIAVALISGAVAIITTIIPKSPIGQSSPSPSGSVSPSVNTADAIHTADEIAGKWSGEARTTSGETFTINAQIRQSCRLNEKCGTISVLQVPCYGEISLKALQNEDYEFDVSNFDSRSSPKCTPGAGEHFKPLPDGKLSYRADWGVQGILDKVQ